jgi:hypothetical protein
MEAVHTSETSVNFNVTTRRYIPEDSTLQYVGVVLWAANLRVQLKAGNSKQMNDY